MSDQAPLCRSGLEGGLQAGANDEAIDISAATVRIKYPPVRPNPANPVERGRIGAYKQGNVKQADLGRTAPSGAVSR